VPHGALFLSWAGSRGVNPLAKVVLERRVAVSERWCWDRGRSHQRKPGAGRARPYSPIPRRKATPALPMKSPREMVIAHQCRYLTATPLSGTLRRYSAHRSEALVDTGARNRFSGRDLSGAQRRFFHDLFERCAYRHQHIPAPTGDGRWHTGNRPR